LPSFRDATRAETTGKTVIFLDKKPLKVHNQNNTKPRGFHGASGRRSQRLRKASEMSFVKSDRFFGR
jgi:hypothetical protein